VISRHYRKFCLAAAGVALLLCNAPARADGTETLGPPSIAIAAGTGVAAAGVGLASGQPGSITINVPRDAAVNQVLLYWSCQWRNSGDAEVEVASSAVKGGAIGGPTRFFSVEGVDVYNQTYRADVTGLGLIAPGANTVEVGGLNCGPDAFENSGAALLVVYTAESVPSAVTEIRDGQDLAFCGFPGSLNTTGEQVFAFTPAAADRMAKLWLLVSSVHSLVGGEPRPNRIKLTVGGVETYVNDALSSSDGKAWDTLGLDVLIPAGAGEVRVRIFSEDALDLLNGGSGCPADPRPASFNWLAAAFSLPIGPAAGTCTQGYWRNHGGQWPVTTLLLGDEQYQQATLLALLRTPSRGDASLILAQQLIAAKLNLAAGSDAAAIASTIVQADAILSLYSGKLPYGVRGRDPNRAAMVQLAEALDGYNNGACRDEDGSEGPLDAGPRRRGPRSGSAGASR